MYFSFGGFKNGQSKDIKHSRDSSIDDKPIVKLKKGVKTKNLESPEFIARALAQCLLERDKEMFLESLLAHWEIKKKAKVVEFVDLAKRTFYDLKKAVNPRLDSILKFT